MIEIVEVIKKLKISMITGVPDSLLSELIHSFEQSELNKFIKVAPSEGSAVALASGHYLGSGQPAIVYMQNSGLSNALNPLITLAHKKMFGTPMILLIGWRGEFSDEEIQISDEPQHLIQGSITRKQLNDLEIPFHIGSSSHQEFSKQLEQVYHQAIENQCPVAILIRKGVFDNRTTISERSLKQSSLFVIQKIVELSPKNSIFIGSTGMIGRELLKSTEGKLEYEGRVILNVGAMGHISAIAKGIAISNPSKVIVCIEGDGSLLMHLGSLALSQERSNFKHILINNRSHDSVGGQTTAFPSNSHKKLYRSFSKESYSKIRKINWFSKKIISRKLSNSKSCFIEFLCAPREAGVIGNRIIIDLPRPNKSPKQYGNSLRNWIANNA
jgi:phosphonopyruvate decarboxylase